MHFLDRLIRFGMTFKGRYVRGSSPSVVMGDSEFVYTGGPTFGPFPAARVSELNATFPPALTSSYATHLVQSPLATELLLTEEELEAERAAGRNWLNYGLLAGRRLSIGGRALDGWIFLFGSERWLIQLDPFPQDLNITRTGGVSFSVVAKPFGYLGGTTLASKTFDVSLADIGQSGGPSLSVDPNLQLRIESVKFDGSEVIIGIYPRPGTNPVSFLLVPCGYLVLTMTGDWEGVPATLAVLKTRIQTMGEISTGDSGADWSYQWIRAAYDHTIDGDLLTSVVLSEPIIIEHTGSLPPATWKVGTRTTHTTITDRICKIVHADNGVHVVWTADLDSTVTSTLNAPVVDMSGEFTVSSTDLSIVNGSLNYSITQTGTDDSQATVELFRNGESYSSAQWTNTQALSKSISGVVNSSTAILHGVFSPPSIQWFVAGSWEEITFQGYTGWGLNSSRECTFAMDEVERLSYSLPLATYTGHSTPVALSQASGEIGFRAEIPYFLGRDVRYIQFRAYSASNQVLAGMCRGWLNGSMDSYPMSAITFQQYGKFSAPAASWANPNTTDSAGVSQSLWLASYHPKTHELIVIKQWPVQDPEQFFF